MTTTVEWLNENSLRAFPFKENSSRSDGTVVIPNDFIVDMAFVVPVATTNTFYLKSLMVSAAQITGVIANQSENNVGTFSIPVDSHIQNTGYAIIGAGTYSDARGRIVIGNLKGITSELPEGIYTYTIDATPFELSAIRPDLRRVRGIKVKKADGSISEVIAGIVQLTAGSNVVLENPSPGVIKINALGNDGFIEECGDCLNRFVPPDPIRTINGVPGDENGNVNLISTEQCLEVVPDGSTNSVKLLDKCSQPCCGCTELEFVTTTLSTLKDSLTKLENLAQELQNRESDFFQSVLSSL